MSRSRKKVPIRKDPSNSKGKKVANRKLRRRVKEAIHFDHDTMPLLSEVEDSRNFLDFREEGFTDKKLAEKLKRK